jgi:hypothetical protein
VAAAYAFGQLLRIEHPPKTSILVKVWSNTGQILVKYWSNTGQIAAAHRTSTQNQPTNGPKQTEYWSNAGQTLVKIGTVLAGFPPVSRRGSCRAAAISAGLQKWSSAGQILVKHAWPDAGPIRAQGFSQRLTGVGPASLDQNPTSVLTSVGP